jgi:DNA-binding MarR family transcriptional regulator
LCGVADISPEDALELAQHLRLTVNSLRRIVGTTPLTEAVSRPQEAALGWLERKGPLTTADLARWEHIRPQTMGATVAELLARGLVTKSPDPTDGRRELVSLTDNGRAALSGIASVRDHDLAALLVEQLTESDRVALARALAFLDSLGEPGLRSGGR